MGLYITCIRSVVPEQEPLFVFQLLSVLTQERHWIRRHRLFFLMEAMNSQSMQVTVRLLEIRHQKKVTPRPEQEYFIVDRGKFVAA